MSDTSESLADINWLTSPAAAEFLATAILNESALAINKRLRKSLSPQRARLAAQQIELRAKAKAKFDNAASLFFTAKGLEQATDVWIARYKAIRFAPGGVVADLCCGIGGDLLALAERGPVIGVDRDALAALLALANLRTVASRFSREIVAADIASLDLTVCAAWHLDPDRRPQGRRTTRVELHEPSLEAIDHLLTQNRNAAIKLAPACDVPEHWRESAELEWISRGGECRQLVAWFGKLVRHSGLRVATVVDRTGEPVSLVEQPGAQATSIPLRELGAFVYDPDPAVLAADLLPTLAADHGLALFDPRGAYLTAAEAISHPLLQTFRVEEVLPLDATVLRQTLAQRQVGIVEVKKRGVDTQPEALRKQLKLSGKNAASLILTKLGKRPIAILAQRVG